MFFVGVTLTNVSEMNYEAEKCQSAQYTFWQFICLHIPVAPLESHSRLQVLSTPSDNLYGSYEIEAANKANGSLEG